MERVVGRVLDSHIAMYAPKLFGNERQEEIAAALALAQATVKATSAKSSVARSGPRCRRNPVRIFATGNFARAPLDASSRYAVEIQLRLSS